MKHLAWMIWLAVVGCGSDDDGVPAVADGAPVDAVSADAAGADADSRMSIFDTGLYADDGETLAEGVMAYTVNHPLWADGADKTRYVLLPDSTTIDTTDMDYWAYPEGTKLWKEFSVGETRVETRLIWKQGPDSGDWFAVSFAWNEDQTQAYEVPLGVVDALGTDHDIPGRQACRSCHIRQPDFVLGYSAIQLDHAEPGSNLGQLIADGRLSTPPAGDASPYFALPGQAVDQAALGYLHGNCGGCHHPSSDVHENNTPLVLRLMIDSMATVEETGAYTTANDVQESVPIDSAAPIDIIEPGVPAESALFTRMSARGAFQMPPIASNQPDDDGLDALEAWILQLTAP